MTAKRVTPYVGLTLTSPGVEALRRMSATLSGKTCQRVTMSSAVLIAEHVVNGMTVEEAAAKVLAK